MQWVLDTNVVASALLWNGSPRQLLQYIRDGGDVRLFSSPALLAELTDILSRRKFEKIAASLLSVDQLVDLYAGFTSLVRPVSVPRIAPDPDDDIVIGTGLAARASLIVTGDQSLLSVGGCSGVRIVSVSEALSEISQN